MILHGIDLAWQSDKNATAISTGTLESGVLTVTRIMDGLYSLQSVIGAVGDFPGSTGVAIDAPLIVRNQSGQRPCEREVGKAYGSRKASCHTSNLTLYPDAQSVILSDELRTQGFCHLNSDGKWQIECYPHPAIIEIFGFDERLLYKKGKVSERRHGQKLLGQYLLGLAQSPILPLEIPAELRYCTNSEFIESLAGASLKHNEDLLDSIVCLYIAGLFASDVKCQVFGDTTKGYIYIPSERCV